MRTKNSYQDGELSQIVVTLNKKIIQEKKKNLYVKLSYKINSRSHEIIEKLPKKASRLRLQKISFLKALNQL